MTLKEQGPRIALPPDEILLEGAVPLALLVSLAASIDGPFNVGIGVGVYDGCPHVRGGPCPEDTVEFLELSAPRDYAGGTFQTAWCPRHRWLIVLFRR